MTWGAERPDKPEFQLGEGCLLGSVDGTVSGRSGRPWTLASIPPTFERHLRSIYRFNYKRQLYDHESVQRIFALNDEAALVICDYGKGKRPEIPFPYFAEVLTGIEYLAAAHMIYAGMVREGAECIENTRRRFDGERRNPWDEAECGHHYARAMSAWSGVLALSGFRYVGPDKGVIAAPRIRPANFTSFWSTSTGWGTFSQSIQGGRVRFSLSVLAGSLPCRSVELAGEVAAGSKSSAGLGQKSLSHQLRTAEKRVTFVFDDAIDLVVGDKLVLQA